MHLPDPIHFFVQPEPPKPPQPLGVIDDSFDDFAHFSAPPDADTLAEQVKERVRAEQAAKAAAAAPKIPTSTGDEVRSCLSPPPPSPRGSWKSEGKP